MSRRYFEHLKEEYIETEDYGGFYEEARKSVNVSDRDALHIMQNLEEGNQEAALEQLEELLVS